MENPPVLPSPVVPIVQSVRKRGVRKFVMPVRGRWVCPNCDFDIQSVKAFWRKFGRDGEYALEQHARGECVKPDTPQRVRTEDEMDAQLWPGVCPKGGLAYKCEVCRNAPQRALFSHGEKKFRVWGRVVLNPRFVVVV